MEYPIYKYDSINNTSVMIESEDRAIAVVRLPQRHSIGYISDPEYILQTYHWGFCSPIDYWIRYFHVRQLTDRTRKK